MSDKCPSEQVLLALLADGKLNDPVRAHVAECRTCKQTIVNLQAALEVAAFLTQETTESNQPMPAEMAEMAQRVFVKVNAEWELFTFGSPVTDVFVGEQTVALTAAQEQHVSAILGAGAKVNPVRHLPAIPIWANPTPATDVISPPDWAALTAEEERHPPSRSKAKRRKLLMGAGASAVIFLVAGAALLFNRKVGEPSSNIAEVFRPDPATPVVRPSVVRVPPVPAPEVLTVGGQGQGKIVAHDPKTTVASIDQTDAAPPRDTDPKKKEPLPAAEAKEKVPLGAAAPVFVTKPSGLQYLELKIGTGKEAKLRDMVTVHYTGSLENGKKFDSSLDRNLPSSFLLVYSNATKGFVEGVIGMKEGGKRTLFIPPRLGYGDKKFSAPSFLIPIPPKAELHFEVELLEVSTFYNGVLAALGSLTALDSSYRDKKKHKAYAFLMEAGRTYQIDMKSKAFDAYLYLEDPDGILLAQDDDGGGNLDARIIHKATKTGNHRIIATHLGSSLGQFTLTIRQTDGAPPPEANKGVDAPPDVAGNGSRLRYVELKVGTGKEAKAGDTVTVHYTNALKDGKKFDSSLDRNAPFTFLLGKGNVIKGWDEGVIGMKEGGKRMLIIPPELGYGAQGFPGVVPPNAELHCEVELLNVK